MNHYNMSVDDAREAFQVSHWKKHYVGANSGKNWV